MKNILMIVGSLRKQSFNLQLAQKAAELMAGRANVTFLDYTDVPFMNQDFEYPAPDSVARVRAEVLAADGLWIFTPQYNSSYPGVLKNVLDWLSRPLVQGDMSKGTALSKKKVTLSGAGGRTAALESRQKLRELLGAMRMAPLPEVETGVSLGPDSFKTNVLTLSEEDVAALQAQVDAFLTYLDI